jgi:hypothetical protein
MRKFNFLKKILNEIRYFYEECFPGCDYVCCDTNLPTKVSKYHTAIFRIQHRDSTAFRSGDELYQITRRHISEANIFTAVISSDLKYGPV